MQKWLKSNQWRKICVQRTFKMEIEKVLPNNSDILQNCFSQKLGFPLFDFQKFQDSEKGTPESCRMHLNGMNDEEFWSTKLLKLKYRRGDQIIQTFSKIDSCKILGPLSLISRNLRTVRKSTPESCRINWSVMNDEEFASRKLLKFKYKRRDQILQTFCKIRSPRN